MDSQRHNKGHHKQSTLGHRSLYLSQKYGEKARKAKTRGLRAEGKKE